MIIALKKKSKFKRIFLIPKSIICHYKISRRYANRISSLKIALTFTKLMLD